MKITTMISCLCMCLCISCSSTPPSPTPLVPTPLLSTEQPSPSVPAERVTPLLPTQQLSPPPLAERAISPLPTQQPSPSPSAEQITSSPPTDEVGDAGILYQGLTQGRDTFQVHYDSETWDYVDYAEFGGIYPEPFLFHRRIFGCRFNLGGGPLDWPEADMKETVNLAGHEWARDTHNMVTGGRYILYHAILEETFFLFTLKYQNPLPNDQAMQCLADGESVLDTFQVQK